SAPVPAGAVKVETPARRVNKTKNDNDKREVGMTATTGQSKLGMVLRVTSGNFLEMFDFFLSGVYASYIAKAFFPLENEYASLLLTFVAFGAGFLMRPLGAIILGAYVDRIGRRKGLIVTLSIMAAG